MFRQWTWNLDRTSSPQSFITLVPWPLSWTIFFKIFHQNKTWKNHLGGPNFHPVGFSLVTEKLHKISTCALGSWQIYILATTIPKFKPKEGHRRWVIDDLLHPYPPQGRIFARSEPTFEASTATMGYRHQNYDQIFVIQPLEQAGKQKDSHVGPIQDWGIADLLHPYQSWSSSKLTTLD